MTTAVRTEDSAPPEEQPPASRTQRLRRAFSDGWRVAAVAAASVAAVVPALLLLHAFAQPSGIGALKKCTAPKSPTTAAKRNKGVELQSNRARPTMALALADKQFVVDDITFSAKNRQVVSKANSDLIE